MSAWVWHYGLLRVALDTVGFIADCLAGLLVYWWIIRPVMRYVDTAILAMVTRFDAD